MRISIFTQTFLVLLLTACAGITLPSETPFSNLFTEPAVYSTSPQVTLESSEVTATPDEINKLRLWLPPELNPDADTPGAELLRAQLDEFSDRNGIEIAVRIKAIRGVGGMIDSLTTTSGVAQSALPDLVALPRDLLEIAALKGFLHSYDGLTVSLDDSDWYDYSQELARIQNSVFGLPFAGDALVLAYRPEVIPTPPGNWAETLNSSWPLVFAASDPQSLFTITMYRANQGAVVDNQGRPFLDSIPLSEVLTYYLNARLIGVMPDRLVLYQSEKQVWKELMEQKADQVVVWASSFLASPPSDVNIAPLPTPDGVSFTQASGWVWALVTRQDENYSLAVELAEFLTDSQFLAKWIVKLGYLPARSSALDGWSDEEIKSLLDRIAISAHLFPSNDILSEISTPLQQATVQILNGQYDAVTAAQTAAASLTSP